MLDLGVQNLGLPPIYLHFGAFGTPFGGQAGQRTHAESNQQTYGFTVISNALQQAGSWSTAQHQVRVKPGLVGLNSLPLISSCRTVTAYPPLLDSRTADSRLQGSEIRDKFPESPA